ncbi:MAG: YhjD/YihY/BrkB family envelope integrity protein [Candidatus Euphemobacter frigidus]|nr:YhjD/YihY/BrkB family envelope integrity protein [Candidatus Euphemobacter frigidus]MDP8276690.1 YhjD/YihY/BrkB family envelope integrity protein [Candidatus Euphemobacter frigidus]
MENSTKKNDPVSPITRYINFFTRDIWALELTTLSWARRLLVRLIKIVYLVVRGFLKDSCPLRSSALTFASLLAVVPLLAFAFSLARGGFGVDISPLKSFLIEKVALGNEEIGSRLFTFVDNIKAGTLGPPALVLLVVTIISVMGNIELSFNHIWGVQRSRTIWRKFSDYLSVLLIVPLFIAAGVTIGGVLRSNQLFATVLHFHTLQVLFWATLNRLLICLGFSFLYIFMPNTRVKVHAALIGGLVAGLVWQAALWGYITFQVGFVKYANIYGALASIPINLVWLYISWNIVLLGAEISFAVQNIRTFHGEETALSRSWAYQELVALNLLVRIGSRFLQGKPPGGVEELAGELDVPIRLVNQVLQEMVEGGLINEVSGNQRLYQPARDLSALTVKTVIEVLRNSGGPEIIPPTLKKSPAVWRIEEILDKSLAEGAADLTMEDLLGSASSSAPSFQSS